MSKPPKPRKAPRRPRRPAQGAHPALAHPGPGARGRPGQGGQPPREGGGWGRAPRRRRIEAPRRGRRRPGRGPPGRPGAAARRAPQGARGLGAGRRRALRRCSRTSSSWPAAERVPVREVGRGQLLRGGPLRGPPGRAGQGRAAARGRPRRPGPGARRRTPPFLLALDGVTDPGNLGALLRSAECAGVTGVVLPRHRAVHVTPTVTKAAAGAVEHLPLRRRRRAARGPAPTCAGAGVWVVGLDADGATSLWDLPAADGPICLVLGAEGAGLSRLVRAALRRGRRHPAAGSLRVAQRRPPPARWPASRWPGPAGCLGQAGLAPRPTRSTRHGESAAARSCFRFFRFRRFMSVVSRMPSDRHGDH